jgi:type IV pilus assembly protein PilB
VKPKPKILGQLLVEAGALTPSRLEEALSQQRGTGHRLGTVLVERGWADEESVARCLSHQLSLPYEPPPLRPDSEALKTVEPELARRGWVLPLGVRPGGLRLAMADPLDLAVLDDVQFQCGRRVNPVVASPSAVLDGLTRGYGEEIAHLLEELPPRGTSVVDPDVDALEKAARSAPVVRLVDHILTQAVEQGASDIHIEAHRGEIRIRYRLDGILRRVLKLPAHSHAAVLSRLKIMAGMDISVKRKPQDGGLVFSRAESELSLRVSSLPVKGGEKAVVRILDPSRAPDGLDQVGLSGTDLPRLRSLLNRGQGVILASGPTGSGKSSTLFAALAELEEEGKNLTTLEDPVEYRLAGANQVQVNPRAGLTFPSALRSLLRQDPDVIMVGEIRDRETAEIAMAAAVTGHLVLSSIHTVDAPGAITRLLNMGVPPYLVAGGLAGVVAQRLVRRVCAACGGRSGRGCGACPDGYRGRTGVFQVLAMTDALRESVARGASVGTLRRLARDGGMGSLREDALRKVAEGITTPHEVARVVRGDTDTHLPCPGCDGEIPLGAEGCPWCGRRRVNRCSCGREIRPEWRFCPQCLART